MTGFDIVHYIKKRYKWHKLLVCVCTNVLLNIFNVSFSFICLQLLCDAKSDLGLNVYCILTSIER